MADPAVRVTVIPGRVLVLGGAMVTHIVAMETAGSSAVLDRGQAEAFIDALCHRTGYWPTDPDRIRGQQRVATLHDELQVYREATSD